MTTTLQIINYALDRIGVANITTLGSDGTPQDSWMNSNYSQCWKQVMRDAGVNATRRRAELQYTSMALTLSSGAVGAGVTATAASAFFRAADVGSDILELGDDATGEAAITAYTSSTVVTVENTVAWYDSTPAANYWRLVPVGVEYAYTYEVPTGFVKAISLDAPEDYPYVIEGNRILTDYTDAILVFDYFETDPDQWDSKLWQAIVSFLAKEACIPLTHDLKLYQIRAAEYAIALAEAKGASKSERQPVRRISPTTLLDVR